MRTRRTVVLAFLAMAIGPIAACGEEVLLQPTGDLATDLANAEARWAAQGLDDYEYTVRLMCFCPNVTAMRVEVVNGAVVSVRPAGGGAPLSPEQAEGYPTVAGLFARVHEALGTEGRQVRASFDTRRGYPTEVVLDEHLMPVDGGMVYTTGSLQPIR